MLKNLVTDMPAPITTKLAQTGSKKLNAAAFALMDNNVSTQMLKNLVTDMPAPITTKLAQTGSSGVPVTVNPESMMMNNNMGNARLGLQEVRIGPDELNLNQKARSSTILAQTENPVVNPPFNNWSVNQPSVPHDHGMNAYEDLGQNIIVDGHPIHYNKKNKKDATQFAQFIPVSEQENQPGNFKVLEIDAEHSPLQLAQKN